jgi:hypothetical protein
MEWPPVVLIVAYGLRVPYAPPCDGSFLREWGNPTCLTEALPQVMGSMGIAAGDKQQAANFHNSLNYLNSKACKVAWHDVTPEPGLASCSSPGNWLNVERLDRVMQSTFSHEVQRAAI